MAQHYGIAVMPARPRKRRDKAKVENGVGIVERWILAALRHRKFFDRYQRRSVILTSQVPIAHWHEQIGDPSIADSILDRLVHNAFRIELSGGSMRKKRGKKPEESAA